MVKIKIPNNPPIAYKLETKSFNRSIDLFWFFQRWIHLPFFFYISILFHSYSTFFWQWLVIDGRNILDNNLFVWRNHVLFGKYRSLFIFSVCLNPIHKHRNIATMLSCKEKKINVHLTKYCVFTLEYESIWGTGTRISKHQFYIFWILFIL